jgi:hypothetical protein
MASRHTPRFRLYPPERTSSCPYREWCAGGNCQDNDIFRSRVQGHTDGQDLFIVSIELLREPECHSSHHAICGGRVHAVPKAVKLGRYSQQSRFSQYRFLQGRLLVLYRKALSSAAVSFGSCWNWQNLPFSQWPPRCQWLHIFLPVRFMRSSSDAAAAGSRGGSASSRRCSSLL